MPCINMFHPNKLTVVKVNTETVPHLKCMEFNHLDFGNVYKEIQNPEPSNKESNNKNNKSS